MLKTLLVAIYLDASHGFPQKVITLSSVRCATLSITINFTAVPSHDAYLFEGSDRVCTGH